jgi:hypothetical protein
MPAPTRRTAAVIAAAGTAAVVAAVGLALFQPWRLVTDTVVDEAPPGAGPISMTSSSTVPPTLPLGPESTAPTARTTVPAGPVTLARGTFITHEHDTSGMVAVVRLADGSRVLRLEGLDTSDGPDLEVWITDAPVIEGRDGWHVFDDGRYRGLGQLKGNQGNQNYAIPADLDLGDYRSVSIWCNRFNVSFGAAKLAEA